MIKLGFFVGAIKVIFLLGFLVFIHEGGHFLVAKACNIYVKEFSLGFGKKIFSFNGKETKYSIRLIPLGGYVSMLGEDERSEDERSFSKASILKRAVVIISGATVNIIFGIVLYFSLMAISGNNPSLIIESFSDEYSAVEEYLKPGDIILEINGKKLHIKSDLDREMANFC